MLRIYTVGAKLLNLVKSMYINSLDCVKVKKGGSERECFKVGGGVKKGYIMSVWLFNVYMDLVMKK